MLPFVILQLMSKKTFKIDVSLEKNVKNQFKKYYTDQLIKILIIRQRKMFISPKEINFKTKNGQKTQQNKENKKAMLLIKVLYGHLSVLKCKK